MVGVLVGSAVKAVKDIAAGTARTLCVVCGLTCRASLTVCPCCGLHLAPDAAFPSCRENLLERSSEAIQ